MTVVSVVSKLLEALKGRDDRAVALRVEQIIYVDQDDFQRLFIGEFISFMSWKLRIPPCSQEHCPGSDRCCKGDRSLANELDYPDGCLCGPHNRHRRS